MLWIDQPDAEDRLAAIESSAVRAALFDLRDRGYTIVEDAVPAHVCDSAIADFKAFCRDNPAHSAEFTTETGLHSRLYNIHTQSGAVFDIAMASKVLNILDHLFSNRAALDSTLFFEQGSQQEIHRDTPFFMTDPYPGEFAGVWCALEDVSPDAGPLTYIEGGHKINVDLESAKLAGDVSSQFLWYCNEIQQQCQAAALPSRTLLIKKGSVLIWHPELPHGGTAIRTPGRTRHSVVTHYMPEGAYVQTVGYFFGLEPVGKIMEFMAAPNDRLMRWVDKPIFMPNA